MIKLKPISEISQEHINALPNEKESLLALFVSRDSYLSCEQIDKAAKNAHEKYCSKFHKDMNQKDTAVNCDKKTVQWEDLEKKYKSANIDQAAYFPVILELTGYVLNTKRISSLEWSDIPYCDRLQMAKLEHGRWNSEKIIAGWRHGEIRDNSVMFHRDIKHWDDLSPEVRNYDFCAIEEQIGFYRRCGLYLHKI
jgi:hypothetical protein